MAVIVVGDSMAPRLSEGDQVVFSPINVPRPKVKLGNGKIIFVWFNHDSAHGGCTIARWSQYDNQIVLHKDNLAYPPIPCRPEDTEQVAVAIERRTCQL